MFVVGNLNPLQRRKITNIVSIRNYSELGMTIFNFRTGSITKPRYFNGKNYNFLVGLQGSLELHHIDADVPSTNSDRCTFCCHYEQLNILI